MTENVQIKYTLKRKTAKEESQSRYPTSNIWNVSIFNKETPD